MAHVGSPTGPSLRPTHARERVREEMTTEILAVAGAHVAREGAAALSFAPSPGISGWHPRRCTAISTGGTRCSVRSSWPPTRRWPAEAEGGRRGGAAADVPTGRRGRALAGGAPRPAGWALEHPHQWGLIFGTPVPGYQAPEDTVEPYARMRGGPGAPAGGGQRKPGGSADEAGGPVSDELRAAVAPVSEGLLPGMSVDTVVSALEAWTTIVGAISLEVFGHWRNTVLGTRAALRSHHRRSGRGDRPGVNGLGRRRQRLAGGDVQRRDVAQHLRPCPQLLEPVLGDPFGHALRRDRRRAPPAPPAPCSALPA